MNENAFRKLATLVFQACGHNDLAYRGWQNTYGKIYREVPEASRGLVDTLFEFIKRNFLYEKRDEPDEREMNMMINHVYEADGKSKIDEVVDSIEIKMHDDLIKKWVKDKCKILRQLKRSESFFPILILIIIVTVIVSVAGAIYTTIWLSLSLDEADKCLLMLMYISAGLIIDVILGFLIVKGPEIGDDEKEVSRVDMEITIDDLKQKIELLKYRITQGEIWGLKNNPNRIVKRLLSEKKSINKQ